jgi:hypothetical protein
MSRMLKKTEMETHTQMIREITGELTGRRERDILYLRTRIEEFQDTPAIAETLCRILGCLAGAGMQQAAA